MSNTFYTNAHQSQIQRLIPDLIRARQLLMDLIWKDIRVRYRYAAMGFAWAILEPLIMMLVLTFVFSVVQNLARSRYRRLASRLRLVKTYEATSFEPPVDANEAGHANDQGERNSAIWQHVQQLPPRQRDIIELVFCRELTVEAASEVMGVTTGTGRVHYDRAKKALRIKIGELQ